MVYQRSVHQNLFGIINLKKKTYLTIANILKKELANTKPGKKRFNYSQFSPNVALNYISFKTGHKFNSFINDVLKDHVGLAGKLRMNGKGIEFSLGKYLYDHGDPTLFNQILKQHVTIR